jgi:peptidoglycan/xylan/chitin deacetylase (PgdA/CDA1 family)
MKYLYNLGYNTITLDEVVNCFKSNEKLLKKKIAITFDDGYLDNYTNALPILQEYNFSATIFVISNFLGKKIGWNNFQPLEYMDWSHCIEMTKYGFSIQSHTCNHPDLKTLKDEDLMYELKNSKTMIESKVSQPVNHLCYPYGRYNRKVMQRVEDAGYLAAYAVNMSEMDLFCMERFPVLVGIKSLIFPLEVSPWGSWTRTIWNSRPEIFK